MDWTLVQGMQPGMEYHVPNTRLPSRWKVLTSLGTTLVLFSDFIENVQPNQQLGSTMQKGIMYYWLALSNPLKGLALVSKHGQTTHNK